ncbi:hypothetical protein J8273_0279 [Carpediemonas membranifera]|uniref:Transmembrane protein n=1 Tax=Carpediemonas membranifera TaxID=201153 RepID=A0A8J6E2T3_9EUKA|nr:hypothetical protein J8273_0279 [Carpediemonas membranifera]|eukprot:KAG9395063.1 hypothetical protein J8273_0279 [Carpediemonas membranifera]
MVIVSEDGWIKVPERRRNRRPEESSAAKKKEGNGESKYGGRFASIQEPEITDDVIDDPMEPENPFEAIVESIKEKPKQKKRKVVDHKEAEKKRPFSAAADDINGEELARSYRDMQRKYRDAHGQRVRMIMDDLVTRLAPYRLPKMPPPTLAALKGYSLFHGMEAVDDAVTANLSAAPTTAVVDAARAALAGAMMALETRSPRVGAMLLLESVMPLVPDDDCVSLLSGIGSDIRHVAWLASLVSARAAVRVLMTRLLAPSGEQFAALALEALSLCSPEDLRAVRPLLASVLPTRPESFQFDALTTMVDIDAQAALAVAPALTRTATVTQVVVRTLAGMGRFDCSVWSEDVPAATSLLLDVGQRFPALPHKVKAGVRAALIGSLDELATTDLDHFRTELKRAGGMAVLGEALRNGAFVVVAVFLIMTIYVMLGGNTGFDMEQ